MVIDSLKVEIHIKSLRKLIKVKIPFATSGLVLTRNTHFKEIISVNSRFRSNNSSNTSPRRDPEEEVCGFKHHFSIFWIKWSTKSWTSLIGFQLNQYVVLHIIYKRSRKMKKRRKQSLT